MNDGLQLFIGGMVATVVFNVVRLLIVVWQVRRS
ncbi:hypothetical protein LCGC14_0275760 [marine sediment metagenome]|uniref:Uncharacterized protein n=1 Tax=marine sediment metagenome TaxID=412755 RepID=A0A0F9TXP3_9ZZZZ